MRIVILIVACVILNTELFCQNCSFSTLSVERHPCENGEFFIDFFFQTDNTTSGFTVSIDGTDFGTFAYGEDYYTLGPLLGESEVVYDLIIADLDDPLCSEILGFGSRDCSSGECELGQIELIDMECETDSTYSLVFDINGTDTDTLDVWVNGFYEEVYSANYLPISIYSILANDSNYDILQVCLNNDEFCCSELEYMVPSCINNGFCSRENLEVYDIECDSDSTYSMTFNADVINGPTDFIEVSVFTEYQGEFNVNDLPITLTGVVLVDDAEDILLVCAGGLDACCNALNYEEPDCIPDNVNEIQNQFLVYPNPVSENLIIQSGELSGNLNMVIYDLSGRAVFSQTGISNEISVSELTSGVYQLSIFSRNERVFTTQMIKK